MKYGELIMKSWTFTAVTALIGVTISYTLWMFFMCTIVTYICKRCKCWRSGKAIQNPLAAIISLPFENNYNTNIGPSDSLANVLYVKPVYPAKLGSWNLINRFVLPAIYTQGQYVSVPPGTEIDSGYAGVMELAQGSEFGLGHITYQAFFSPADSGKWVWSVGPVFVLPTELKGTCKK